MNPLDGLAKPDGQVAAMEAIFQLYDAVNDHGLSTVDLEAVVRLAVRDGHDMLMIVLQMVSLAVRLAKPK